MTASSFMAQLGAKLVDAGFPILPIQPGSKKPGVFRRGAWRDYPDWSRHGRRETTDHEVDVWGNWPEAGIGIATGRVIGIDIDVLSDPQLAKRIEDLAREMLGDTPALRIGRAPKRLLVYRADRPFKGFKRPPIDVLGLGQQFVAYGLHPETGQPYDWPLESLADTLDFRFVDGPHSPWTLLEGARAVYTVSSQLGFEAILSGHRPRVFGHPFYAGWGLSADESPTPRRTRSLTVPQLFAGAMLLAPIWYDPLRDRLCDLPEVIDFFEARLRAFRQDRNGHVASGMRLWKRGHLQAFFGTEKTLRFADQGATLAWASATPTGFTGLRVEDGFLRSRGLGAELVPPLSLVVDDLGIYYDPGRESRLERLIASPLPPGGGARAARLRAEADIRYP